MRTAPGSHRWDTFKDRQASLITFHYILEITDVSFGLKVGQICTKWNKSNCPDNILVHCSSPSYTISNWCQKVRNLFQFGAKPGIQRKKYHKKGHNSVILTDKHSKNLHNLHMAITHLNPYSWIRIYNGFAEIPDLRQTGITENLATFGQFFSCEFFSVLCLFLCKKN